MSSKQLLALARLTGVMYWHALRDSFRALLKNWWAVLLPLPYGVAFFVVHFVVQPLGMVGGLILGLLGALLLTHFLTFIRAGVSDERLTLRGSIDETKELFSPVISVLFVLWIVSMVIGYFADLSAQGAFPSWIVMLFNLLLVTLFNPLLEIVIFGGRRDLEAFSASLEFVRENAVEWFAPLVLILLVFVSADPREMLTTLVGNGLFNFFYQLLGRGVAAILSPTTLLSFALFSALLSTILMFRGALYLRLARSSRRKRLYECGLL